MSAILADMIQARLVESGDILVLPKLGGKSATIERPISEPNAAGYRVDLVNMAVSSENAFRRMVGRLLKTGRLINPTCVGDVFGTTCARLRDKGTADGYAELDDSGPGPVLREQRDTDLYQTGSSSGLLGDGGDRGQAAGGGSAGEAGAQAGVRAKPGRLG